MVTRKNGMDMDDVVVRGKGDTRKPEDMVDLYALPDKKYVKLRPFGAVHPYQGHWIETKKKDGGKGSFYYPCAAFDIETGQTDSTKHCPWCDDESGHVRTVTDYFFNAIHRREQQNKPVKIRATAAETESGFKEKSSESWTPVKAIRVTGNTLRKLQALKQLNTVENADGDSINYGVSHPKYGADISIKKDKDLPPASMYDVQYGAQTSMTKEERTYLVWDLTALMITPSQKEAEGEYVKWAQRMGLISSKGKKKVDADDDGDDSDDDEDDAPKAKVKAKPSKKAAPVDDDEDFDDDEDDEDEAPKSKAKAKPAAKKKVVDEDDEDEDEDEDEDDAPPPKKKPASKAAASKKKVVDEDDDDFDDEEDDEPPAKKKPSASKKKAAPVDDDEDEDDEEDDEPPAKKKPAAKVAAKKKAAPVDDDEDDDFDEDEEDDEPPAKKKPAAKASAKKPVAKKKAAADDEDDEDF